MRQIIIILVITSHSPFEETDADYAGDHPLRSPLGETDGDQPGDHPFHSPFERQTVIS